MRAIDCSLTTSMEWPMCRVEGMQPRAPRTNSHTSCTENTCRSSSKIAGKELSRAACRGEERDEEEEEEGEEEEGCGQGQR